jgi:hypothetical protein
MANITKIVSDPVANEAAELERLGITVTTATFFHWKGYRYTTARDALYAARRDERTSRESAS